MDIVEFLVNKCIEKYKEFADGVADDSFYGKVPKMLVIEYMNSKQMTADHY